MLSWQIMLESTRGSLICRHTLQSAITSSFQSSISTVNNGTISSCATSKARLTKVSVAYASAIERAPTLLELSSSQEWSVSSARIMVSVSRVTGPMRSLAARLSVLWGRRGINRMCWFWWSRNSNVNTHWRRHWVVQTWARWSLSWRGTEMRLLSRRRLVYVYTFTQRSTTRRFCPFRVSIYLRIASYL